MIPKTFHRIWLGQNPMPADYVEFGQTWLDLHPGWTLTDWGPQDSKPVHFDYNWELEPLPVLRNQKHFDALVGNPSPSGVATMPGWQATAVQQADIAAYELIWRFGGVYLNADIKCVKNIEPILEVQNAAVYETEYWVCNNVLVGEQYSEFFDKVINELPIRVDNMPGHFLNEQTGPWLLTDMHLRNPGMLYVYPREYFNPIGALSITPGVSAIDLFRPEDHPDSYGIHGWGHRRAGLV